MMEGSELNGQLRSSNERIHHQRQSAPRPPKPYRSMDKENENTLSNGDTRMENKSSTGNAKERPVIPPKSVSEGGHSVLAFAGETILETFYGMLYKCADETKEWKLAADGFIPVCFIQEQGNANKPFKVVAVHGSVRVLEYPVTKETKCTQNKAFVRWNDSNSSMFGVRLSKQSQADQFYSAMSRMKSTLLKTADLFKQPERKAMVEGASHRKTSLIVKLPNKETTVMSVPGLMTMGELFEHVCKKEELSPNEHQVSLPKIGSKEVQFEPDTVLGTLKIREIAINYIGRTTNDAAMGDNDFSDEQKAFAVAKARAIPHPYAKQDERPASKQTPTFQRKEENVEKGKNVPLVKPDQCGKIKRKAPPPPPRPAPERPKSMPITRPRSVPSGPTTSSGPPKAKKRQAPSRPPAPKVLRDNRNSNETRTSDMKRSVSAERLPPIFSPPPPPDDVPPPLDECEYPVSPLSDEDLHDTAWVSSSGEHEPGEVTSPSNVSSNKTEQTKIPPPRKPSLPSQADEPGERNFASPEPIPLKFLLPSSEPPAEYTDDLFEREGISSRISFLGDSRSSSVDITSDTEFPTSPIFEDFKLIARDSPMEFTEQVSLNTDIHTTDEHDPQSISPPPPPSGFSSEPIKYEVAVNNSENVESFEYDIESMVIPPPPLMFEDFAESKDAVSKDSDEVQASDVAFSIPPPSDFAFQEEVAKPPDDFDDHETSKKKLGLNSDMFPWLTETQPVFQAEISNSTSDNTIESPPSLEMLNENVRVQEHRDVQMHEVPSMQSNEKPKLESSTNNDLVSNNSSIHESETPTLYKDSDSQQTMKFDNKWELEPSSQVEPDQLVPGSHDSAFKDEHSQHLNEENYQRKTSCESSSSNYKTPFDDFESMAYSEGSLNSEIEEDIFDLKVTTMKEKESHSEDINRHQNTTNAAISDSSVKLEPLKQKEPSLEKEEHQSQGTTVNKRSEYDKRDESLGDTDSKLSSESIASESTVITNDPSVSLASSGKNVLTEEMIESSNSTPIAIPVDILFQSLGSNKNSELTTDIQSDDKDKTQIRPGHKRSVVSGFKTQSWADIKNREKEMEKQRHQKSESKNTGIGSAKTTSVGSISSSQSQKEKEEITEVPKITSFTKPSSTPIAFASVDEKLSSSTVQSKPSNTASISLDRSSVVESTAVASTVKNDLVALQSTSVASSASLGSSSTDKLPSTEVPNKSKSATHYSENANVSSSASLQTSSNDKLSTSQSSQSMSTTSSESTSLREKYSFPVGTRKANYVDSAHSQSTVLSSSLESTKGTSTSPQVVKKSVNSTSSTQGVAAVEPKKPNYVASAHNATVFPSSSMKPSKENPSSTEEGNKPDVDKSSSTQGVVMRQKTEKQEERMQKRTSVHDMMRMFQNPAAQESTKERSDSSEGLPRQSPALRLIEEKVNPPINRQSSSETASDSRSSEKEDDTIESLPRQSPAMRSLEGKINYPNRDRSSSGTSATTKSSTSADCIPSEEENNNIKDTKKLANEIENVPNRQPGASSFKGFKEISETKQKEPESSDSDSKSRTSSINQRKSYGILFPREYKPPNSIATSTKPKETETSETKPRTDSLNARQKYEVLFPKEQKKSSQSLEANTSVEPKKQGESTSDIKEIKRQSIDEKVSTTKGYEERKTIETIEQVQHKQTLTEEVPKPKSDDKKEIEKSKQRRSINEDVLTRKSSESKKDDTPNNDLVIKREKDSSTVRDTSKRHSMPVHLMESASSSQKQYGGNLKILLAPQISDVGVVPKGRVAAMMAAWKKDDQQ